MPYLCPYIRRTHDKSLFSALKALLLSLLLSSHAVVTAAQTTQAFYDLWTGRHFNPNAKGLYMAAASDSFSEVMSIDAVADHFRGPLEPGHAAVTHNSAEAGIVYNGWRAARVLRYDYELQFSEDTALLNFQLEHGGSSNLDLDYPYQLSLRADHIRSYGYLIGKTLPIFTFRGHTALLDIELSWLESRQFYDGYMEGTFIRGQLEESSLADFESRIDLSALEEIETFSDAVEQGELLQQAVAEIREIIASSDLQLDTDYAFYRPGLREDEIDEFASIFPLDAYGKGYTLSLQLFMPITEKWTLQFAAKDLFSEIKWENSGITEGSLHITQAGLDVLDVVDQFIQQDIINRFSGNDFTPLNPANPDDPEAVLPEIQEQILADNAAITARKGSFTQHLPTQYALKSSYQWNSWATLGVLYKRNRVYDSFSFQGLFRNHFLLAVEPESDAYKIGFLHPYASVIAQMDKSDLEDAKRLKIQISINAVY